LLESSKFAKVDVNVTSLVVDNFEVLPLVEDFSNQTKWNHDVSLTDVVDDYDVVSPTNDESIIDEVSKSKFLEVDKTLLNNVNRSGHRVIKYAKVWVVNAFDEWHKFRVLIQKRYIVNMSKDESSIMGLVNMLFVHSSSCKKRRKHVPSHQVSSLILFYVFINFAYVFLF